MVNHEKENSVGTRYCVLIPAYREEKNIALVVQTALKYCLDVIVIDDGSPDKTAEEAAMTGAIVIRHEVNQGKGVALNTGFREVRERGYDVVITMDADGQHDPELIKDFIEAYDRTGIPVLIGNRMSDVSTMPLVRRWTNQFMSWLLSRTMGQFVPDTQCGYRLYRCDLIPYVATESERFAAESEILLHIAERGVRMDSVPVSTIYENGNGASKINPFSDTIRFFSMLTHYKRELRKRQNQK